MMKILFALLLVTLQVSARPYDTKKLEKFINEARSLNNLLEVQLDELDNVQSPRDPPAPPSPTTAAPPSKEPKIVKDELYLLVATARKTAKFYWTIRQIRQMIEEYQDKGGESGDSDGNDDRPILPKITLIRSAINQLKELYWCITMMREVAYTDGYTTDTPNKRTLEDMPGKKPKKMDIEDMLKMFRKSEIETAKKFWIMNALLQFADQMIGLFGGTTENYTYENHRFVVRSVKQFTKTLLPSLEESAHEMPDLLEKLHDLEEFNPDHEGN